MLLEAAALVTLLTPAQARAEDLGGISVINADGSGVTDVSNSPGEDEVAGWSPDGKRIAFESDRDGARDIYLVNLDGSAVTNVTHTPDFDELWPRWSPDGTRLAFEG